MLKKKKKITQSERKFIQKVKEHKKQKEEIIKELSRLYQKFYDLSSKEQDGYLARVLQIILPKTKNSHPLPKSVEQEYLNLLSEVKYEINHVIKDSRSKDYRNNLKKEIKLLLFKLIQDDELKNQME